MKVTGTGVGAAVNTTNALADALKVPSAATSKGADVVKLVAVEGKTVAVDTTKPAATTEDTGTAKPAAKAKAKSKKPEVKKDAIKAGETKKAAPAAKKKEDVKAKEKKVNPKLEKARKIFDKNTDKAAGEIAGLISKGLEITYSNAYYYVTRVFNKKSKKSS